MNDETTHRSGYCAIVGRPNAGKSTFLNQIMGIKLAISTHKPQTTRDRILGILNRPNGQICFVDTPGLHSAKGGINKYMVRQAEAAIQDADVILWMAEIQPKSDNPLSKGMERIHQLIEATGKPWVLALNKVDRMQDKTKLLPRSLAGRRLLTHRVLSPSVPRTMTIPKSFSKRLSLACPQAHRCFPTNF